MTHYRINPRFKIDTRLSLETPEASVSLLKTTIEQNWNKYVNRHRYTPTETTYLLFENLFRVIRGDSELMVATYDALTELNENVNNEEMVSHLQDKKIEYLQSLEDANISRGKD